MDHTQGFVCEMKRRPLVRSLAVLAKTTQGVGGTGKHPKGKEEMLILASSHS
jgi:hypothetical protein